MSRRAALWSTVVIGTGALALPGAARATYPGQNGPILFTAFAYDKKAPGGVGDATLSVVTPEISETATDILEGGDFSSAFSPDGKQIAHGTPRGLYLSDTTGGGLRRISKLEGIGTPTWSRDGKTIVFAHFGTGIWSIPAGGGTARKLISNAGKREVVFEPSYTSDGSAFLYSRLLLDEQNAILRSEIWRAAADGSAPTKLIAGRGQLAIPQQPDMSPDGSKIAFVSETTGRTPKSQIYTAAADGSSPTPLTRKAKRGWAFNQVTWSPDGTQLVVAELSLRAKAGAQIGLVSASSGALTPLRKVKRGVLIAPDWGAVPTS